MTHLLLSKFSQSILSHRSYGISWVVPLPRMPVTTRSITFLGDPNLNLHLPQASWEGGTTQGISHLSHPMRQHHWIHRVNKRLHKFPTQLGTIRNINKNSRCNYPQVSVVAIFLNIFSSQIYDQQKIDCDQRPFPTVPPLEHPPAIKIRHQWRRRGVKAQYPKNPWRPIDAWWIQQRLGAKKTLRDINDILLLKVISPTLKFPGV